jgi:putative Mg2+ transporter-C (MgtC) family protein
VEIGALDLTARVGSAVVLGALIGLEREARDQPAGIRTHALVAVGAALFTIAGAYGFSDVQRDPSVDPARVAAQVATGIGFIGAGAILKIGLSVRGLTTAATLWMAAALGVAAGAGAYLLAALGTVAVLIVVVGLRLVKLSFLNRAILSIEYQPGHGTLGRVIGELEGIGADPGRLRLTDDTSVPGGVRRVSVRVRVREDTDLDRLVKILRQLPEVYAAHWEREA